MVRKNLVVPVHLSDNLTGKNAIFGTDLFIDNLLPTDKKEVLFRVFSPLLDALSLLVNAEIAS
jgi:hypothetical protein